MQKTKKNKKKQKKPQQISFELVTVNYLSYYENTRSSWQSTC